MARATCHYCGEPAQEECPTCGRLYCAEHGEDVCLRCLAPESAMPSALAYRGSLVALAAGSVVAVFLLLRPPESKSSGDIIRTLATSTPVTQPTATATPPRTQGAGTPSTVRTASPTTVGTSPSPAVSPSPAAERTYTVKGGDTLSAIAAQFGVTVDEILALNPGITPELLRVGTELKIPGAR
jgi:LysM repeat protein